MRKIMSISAILLLLLTYSHNLQAGETKTITIGCVIPEISGLNASENTVREEIKFKDNTAILADSAKIQQNSETIQQTQEKEIQLADGKTLIINVETIYSR